jgi:hypothetical protein
LCEGHGGGGGSSGGAGGNASGSTPGSGGLYGGSGGGHRCNYLSNGTGGAVRIVWPGSTRQFPSTCVGSP